MGGLPLRKGGARRRAGTLRAPAWRPSGPLAPGLRARECGPLHDWFGGALGPAGPRRPPAVLGTAPVARAGASLAADWTHCVRQNILSVCVFARLVAPSRPLWRAERRVAARRRPRRASCDLSIWYISALGASLCGSSGGL